MRNRLSGLLFGSLSFGVDAGNAYNPASLSLIYWQPRNPTMRKTTGGVVASALGDAVNQIDDASGNSNSFLSATTPSSATNAQRFLYNDFTLPGVVCPQADGLRSYGAVLRPIDPRNFTAAMAFVQSTGKSSGCMFCIPTLGPNVLGAGQNGAVNHLTYVSGPIPNGNLFGSQSAAWTTNLADRYEVTTLVIISNASGMSVWVDGVQVDVAANTAGKVVRFTGSITGLTLTATTVPTGVGIAVNDWVYIGSPMAAWALVSGGSYPTYTLSYSSGDVGSQTMYASTGSTSLRSGMSWGNSYDPVNPTPVAVSPFNGVMIEQFVADGDEDPANVPAIIAYLTAGLPAPGSLYPDTHSLIMFDGNSITNSYFPTGYWYGVMSDATIASKTRYMYRDGVGGFSTWQLTARWQYYFGTLVTAARTSNGKDHFLFIWEITNDLIIWQPSAATAYAHVVAYCTQAKSYGTVKVIIVNCIPRATSSYFSATIAANVMTVTGVTGAPLAVGMTIYGANVVAGVTITSDSGGGVYGLSASATAVGVAEYMTAGGGTGTSWLGYISGTTLTVTGSVTGTIAIGQLVNAAGIAPNTTITAGSGTSWTVSVSQTIGSVGTPVSMTRMSSDPFGLTINNGLEPIRLAVNASLAAVFGTSAGTNIYTPTVTTSATFNGSISGTTLTVVGGLSGTIGVGQAVTGSGVTAGTVITAGSGSTWTVSISQTVGTVAMSAFPYADGLIDAASISTFANTYNSTYFEQSAWTHPTDTAMTPLGTAGAAMVNALGIN